MLHEVEVDASSLGHKAPAELYERMALLTKTREKLLGAIRLRTNKTSRIQLDEGNLQQTVEWSNTLAQQTEAVDDQGTAVQGEPEKVSLRFIAV